MVAFKDGEKDSSDESRLEDAMRGIHSRSIEITMTFAILFGVLILLSFWAVLAR